MNFDKIKEEMDKDSTKHDMTYEIDLTRGKRNPIQAIRRTMKMEILSQVVVLPVAFSFPFIAEMYMFPKAIYLTSLFLITLMTMGYIFKLGVFLRNTTDLTLSTREVISQFIFDTKLTLEVYKAYMISGSLLIPIAFLALLNGNAPFMDKQLIKELFLFNLSVSDLLLLVFAYLVLAFIMIVVTYSWADGLYMKHIRDLEKLMGEFKVDKNDFV